MNLLNIEDISKNYGDNQLFNNVSFGINEGDKIGFIGINGTGKTTLLRIVAELEKPDSGRVVKGSSVRIEYLPQNISFDPNATVKEQVFKGNSENMRLIKMYQEAISNPETSNEEIMKLTHEMDVLDAWNLESEIKAVLTKLGITDFNKKIGALSGGQKKRIALAAALVNPSELLILDEPTNHLDNETIEWLEEYLGKRKNPLLMITHDRYFLDRVVNQIIELDNKKLYSYKGNYNNFLERKLEREEIAAASERKRQSLIKRELAWINQGAKARSTKQKFRINRFNELSRNPSNMPSEKLEISVASRRLGRKVIEVENIEKSFGNKKIVDDFSYIVLRNDRVGILGPNGCGKSTLINIMSKRLEADSGNVDVGETVKIGVYSQENHHMDDDLRVIEYIREGAEYLTTAEGNKITASQMLERFLFSSTLQWVPIGKLSGGEKRRLHLLRVLMEAPNVLFLDEPTNDLDIETLTILEDYLEEFQGAVIVVSHDRYFLDRVVGKVFAFEGEGRIVQYTGNYTDFKRSNNYEIEKSPIVNKGQKKKKSRPKNKVLKFSYNEKREYEKIDDIIAKLEEEVQKINIKIDEAATDYIRLEELLIEKKELENQLDEKMERWIYLNELAEKIEGQNTI